MYDRTKSGFTWTEYGGEEELESGESGWESGGDNLVPFYTEVEYPDGLDAYVTDGIRISVLDTGTYIKTVEYEDNMSD